VFSLGGDLARPGKPLRQVRFSKHSYEKTENYGEKRTGYGATPMIQTLYYLV